MPNKPILIIQNVSHERLGTLEDVLKKKELPYEEVDLNKENEFPDPQNYSAVIIFGGPDSANDETPKMQNELKKVKEILNLNIPYFGICLGLQVLVKAAGGNVIKNPMKEIGLRDQEGNFYKIELTEAGKNEPLLEGLPDTLTIFHLHGETVELTPEMELLGTGKWCKNQIVKVTPKAYGIQGHFELTEQMFEDWLCVDPDLQKLSQDQLRKDFDLLKNEYTRTSTQIFHNFLKIAKL